MLITGNEPATPLHPHKDSQNAKTNGLTIRQEFAARFMAAMLRAFTPNSQFKVVANDAVECADALINALNDSGK